MFKGPEDKGPKTVKIFINQPSTLDFDKAEGYEPTQLIDLSTEDLTVANYDNEILKVVVYLWAYGNSAEKKLVSVIGSTQSQIDFLISLTCPM